MRQHIGTNTRIFAALLLALLSGAARVEAASAQVEVQAVWANDTDKDGVPASLERYKKVLKEMKFSSFKDKGKKTLNTAAGSKGSAAVGDYSIEIEVKSVAGAKATVAISAKESGKNSALGDPVSFTLTKGEPKQVFQLGDQKAPLVILVTLDDVK